MIETEMCGRIFEGFYFCEMICMAKTMWPVFAVNGTNVPSWSVLGDHFSSDLVMNSNGVCAACMSVSA